MCDVSRREFLTGGAALVAAAAEASSAAPEVGKVDPVAGDIYFHEGDLSGHGLTDIFVGNGYAGQNQILPYTLLNTGSGQFTQTRLGSE